MRHYWWRDELLQGTMKRLETDKFRRYFGGYFSGYFGSQQSMLLLTGTFILVGLLYLPLDFRSGYTKVNFKKGDRMVINIVTITTLSVPLFT